MKPEVIVITGSREWEDREPIIAALKLYPFGSVLIHGGCRGADTIGARFALAKGFKVWELPYFEDESGIEARNQSMVDVASALQIAGHPVTCHAFPLPGARGTWKAVRLMKAAHLRVIGPEGQEL